MGSVVVVGGTAGIGLELASHFAERGRPVVLTGRDAGRAVGVAAKIRDELGAEDVRGLALDLNRPHEIAGALAGVEHVDRLTIPAIERDQNRLANYDIDRAIRLTTLKLVGYTAVVNALQDRLGADSSVLLFGGLARDRPYPGSTTVSTVNAGVVGLTRTLSVELAPVRVNSLHPAIIGDSPYWQDKPQAVENTARGSLTGRAPTTAEVTAAAVFLLENSAVNGVDLRVDGGWRDV
jgi:NAD(P)-dependent dehydrogenase (short-subunit alcohol dehydrogenase family)